MSKIEVADTKSGYNRNVIEQNFDKIATELNDKVLYRTNPEGEPNAMNSTLDMNGQRILNLPVPLSPGEPARLQDIGNITAYVDAAIDASQDAQGYAVAAAASAVNASNAGRLSTGTTTTGVPGSNVIVSITGPAGSQLLNLTIPRGDAGAPGVGFTDGDKGDITISGTGTVISIDNNVVTNAKLADVPTATFKGRTTAGTGDPEDLTVTQATAMLNTVTSGLKGLAPASGGGTTNFLRADGTWASPAGASAPGLILLAVVSASNQASVDFTSLITSTYDTYEIVLDRVVPAAFSFMEMVTSSNNGSSFDGAASNYSVIVNKTDNSSVSNSLYASVTADRIYIGGDVGVSEVASYGGMSGKILLHTFPAGGAHTSMEFHTTASMDSNHISTATGSAKRLSTLYVNAVRLRASAGNITSGNFYLYGRKKS